MPKSFEADTAPVTRGEAMRRVGAALALGMLLSTIGVTEQAAAAPPPTVKLMAVGDSYTAGVGGGSADGNVAHGNYKASCRQEAQVNYAGQTVGALVARNHPIDYRVAACNGAVTSDVWSTVQSGAPNTQVKAVRDFQPDIIVMTIGGNDLGFGQIMTDCVAVGCDTTRIANPRLVGKGVPGERKSWDGFYDRLVYTYNQIHAAAPKAQIYVLTYPIFFSGSTQWSNVQKVTGCQRVPGFVATKINASVQRAGDTIYWATQKANTDTGGKVHFVDWRVGPPDPNGLCSSPNSGSWNLNGIMLPAAPWSKDDSFHPTMTGYKLASDRLVQALAGYPWPTAPQQPQPQPQPVFTVMNTSESPPDGVWFRNSPHTADTSRITGLGVYRNERVRLRCYAWGDPVGAYANRLWYLVDNLSRTTVSGRANSGYLNAHYINDGKQSNVIDAGVPAC